MFGDKGAYPHKSVLLHALTGSLESTAGGGYSHMKWVDNLSSTQLLCYYTSNDHLEFQSHWATVSNFMSTSKLCPHQGFRICISQTCSIRRLVSRVSVYDSLFWLSCLADYRINFCLHFVNKGIPHVMHAALLPFADSVFFTNCRFVAALHRASLLAPVLQQHLLTSCFHAAF